MSLYWNLILNGSYGVLNQAARGAASAAAAVADRRISSWSSILLVDVWMWTPFMMLISLAGLNAIPKYIYEAAEIDRASRWMVFRTHHAADVRAAAAGWRCCFARPMRSSSSTW